MRRWLACAALALVTASLASCTRFAGAPLADPEPSMSQQAMDALTRWDVAAAAFTGPVLIPIGEPLDVAGAPPTFRTSAFMIDQDLPAHPAATATVTWSDGRTASLRTLSANAAWTAAPKTVAGSCAGCPLLHITGADLVSGTVQTTRGPVTMPVWAYRIAGETARITVPAVELPQPVVVPPPWDANHPPAGLQIESARGSVAGQTMTVFFTGARGGADQPCGVDYTPEAVESELAIVVMLHERHYQGEGLAGNMVCNGMGFVRQAEVTLSRPLGERAVLEGREGLPVPTVHLP